MSQLKFKLLIWVSRFKFIDRRFSSCGRRVLDGRRRSNNERNSIVSSWTDVWVYVCLIKYNYLIEFILFASTKLNEDDMLSLQLNVKMKMT